MEQIPSVNKLMSEFKLHCFRSVADGNKQDRFQTDFNLISVSSQWIRLVAFKYLNAGQFKVEK